MINKPVDVLPVPEICDNCASSNIAFVKQEKTFGDRLNLWPYIIKCNDCGASIGCHEGTSNPLGRMADGKTRKLRVNVHIAFDPIWRTGLMRREQAYQWLARQLGIEIGDCHISWLTVPQLRTAQTVSLQFAEQNLHKADRRREKRRDSTKREIRKERTAIRLRKSARRKS